MFLRTAQPTELEINISNFFALYKADIIKLHKNQWNQEDIKGRSKLQFTIGHYYLALTTVILIWLEFREGLETDWEYYKTKYDIAVKKKCLACFNISLDKILDIFGLPPAEGVSGIQGMGIEIDFRVEPSSLDADAIETAKITDLLTADFEGKENCVNLMNTYCESLGEDITNDVPITTNPPPAMTPVPIYYGTSPLTSLTESDVLLLNSRSETSLVNQIFNFGLGDYKWIVIPTTLGVPSNIIDNSTGFSMVMQPPVLISVGVKTYNAYRSTNILGGVITMKLV